MTVRTREAPQEDKKNPDGQGLALEKIYATTADYATSFELINRYCAETPHHQIGFNAGQWFETNSDVYWYFLECLPPLHQTGGGFVVSECTMTDLYECFFEINDRYYCAVLRWTGPKSFSDLWSALLKETRS